jgi:hypothetical protein
MQASEIHQIVAYIDHFHRTHTPSSAATPHADAPLSTVYTAIIANTDANYRLWDYEDQIRDSADPVTRSQLKYQIDQMNQSRNDAIRMIDSAFIALLQPNPTKISYSETPGMIIDRMAIMARRLRAIELLPPDTINVDRHTRVLSQHTHARNWLTRILHEVVTGLSGYSMFDACKLYNDDTLRRLGQHTAATPSATHV